jgi:hypothetical protein
MQGASGEEDGVAVVHVRVGEIDRHLEVVAGDGRVQEQRTLAVEAEIESVEKARASDVEAEFAVGDVGKVAAPVRDEESLVVLEDELRQVRREGGCEDIVLIADGDEIAPVLGFVHAGLAHAERACPARLW